MIIKNNPQLPPRPSTIAPEEDASNVRPAVPTEANKAYCVAVKLLSTIKEIKATNATVANAAARSSSMTAKANRPFEGPAQAKTEKRMFVTAIAIPAIIKVFTIPERIAIAPPISVKKL